ncbi:hypothetical protein ACFOYW_14515 [Gryllotalpicola reticulitermitis]|uniref:Uncharacterized protein n=1 Tax=Gryllotalpicola reticulitermitis TaxID=1184153 RepID=A0ABV8QC58_9MICO
MATRSSTRTRTIAVWGGIAAAVALVIALVGTGRLNADLLPQPSPAPTAPAVTAVQCYDADGNQSFGWSAGASAGGGETATRVDPIAICDALYQDHTAVAQMDTIATAQQALGRDCVTFGTTDGGTWFLTGLETSADGSYTASGGPAPGRLPAFGAPSAPAPLAALAPRPTSTQGCVPLPTVTWNRAVPPMAACTTAPESGSVAVYERPADETADTVCTSQVPRLSAWR